MALKRILESVDGLDENTAKLYVEKNGKFFLDCEDDNEVGPLKRALERERASNNTLKTENEDLKLRTNELEAAASSGGKKNKDIETLEASWQKKLTDKTNELQAVINTKDGYIKSSLVDSAAIELANGLFTVPTVGKRLVAERMKVEFTDEGPKLRIMDLAGSPSAMTLDDLRKEFLDTKELAPMLIASKATGGGAGGAGQGGGGAGSKSFKDMNGSERTILFNTDRARFEREAAALKG